MVSLFDRFKQRHSQQLQHQDHDEQSPDAEAAGDVRDRDAVVDEAAQLRTASLLALLGALVLDLQLLPPARTRAVSLLL